MNKLCTIHVHKFLATCIACFTIAICLGQQKDIAKFIVTKATNNGKDETKLLVSQKAYTVFYKKEDGNLYMANVWVKNKSQSFGRIFIATNDRQNNKDNINFKWNYVNDYDNKSGTAKVNLVKIYDDLATISKLTIITEKRDTIIYQGYMEGSIR